MIAIVVILVVQALVIGFIFRGAIVDVFVEDGDVQISSESVVYDGRNLNLSVERVVESGDLVGLKFLIENELGGSYIYEEDVL